MRKNRKNVKAKRFLTINSNHTACHILEQKVEIQDCGDSHDLRVDLLDSDGSHAFVWHFKLFIDKVGMKQCWKTYFIRGTPGLC